MKLWKSVITEFCSYVLVIQAESHFQEQERVYPAEGRQGEPWETTGYITVTIETGEYSGGTGQIELDGIGLDVDHEGQTTVQ